MEPRAYGYEMSSNVPSLIISGIKTSKRVCAQKVFNKENVPGDDYFLKVEKLKSVLSLLAPEG